MSISKQLLNLKSQLAKHVTLVAVSKTKPIEAIIEAYNVGQRVFGENKIQEMVDKQEQLPKDIEWHMIGHLQSNKVKYMASFVHLIHGVDSLKTLKEINKQALKNNRIINCLLQLKIAKEDTKFGFSYNEVEKLLSSEEFKNLSNIKIKGLMGMASFTENKIQIETEFKKLSTLHQNFVKQHPQLTVLSMGMSSDYTLALDHGSTMVRIGSSIFGARNYN